jgi:predicted nucleic acid-binding protein
VKPVLVDSSVLLDILDEDPTWSAWSEAQVGTLAESALLVINPLIYAEVSVWFRTVEDLEVAAPTTLYARESLPYSAAFLAGKCFQRYRRRGGTRRSPLPDFYIGAHAAIADYRLLTRDARRYRDYFPKLEIIAP